MGCKVAFSYAQWVQSFPSLAPYINNAQAQASFNLATLYQANDGSGPINDPDIALQLLNLLTAHIATLTYPTTGPVTNPDPVSPVVGRIDSATEGSVSFHATNDYPPGSPQFFQQTQWGSMWWEATAQFRTMRYVAPCPRPSPYMPYGFGLGRFR